MFLCRAKSFVMSLVGSVAALFLATEPAAATIYTLTVQGSITDGYDYTGLFGQIGSLVGDSYTISMAFDTSQNADDDQYSPEEDLNSTNGGTTN